MASEGVRRARRPRREGGGEGASSLSSRRAGWPRGRREAAEARDPGEGRPVGGVDRGPRPERAGRRGSCARRKWLSSCARRRPRRLSCRRVDSRVLRLTPTADRSVCSDGAQSGSSRMFRVGPPPAFCSWLHRSRPRLCGRLGAWRVDHRRGTQASTGAPACGSDPGPGGACARGAADPALGLDGAREGTGRRPSAAGGGIRVSDGRAGGRLSGVKQERALSPLQGARRVTVRRVRDAGALGAAGERDGGRGRRGEGRTVRELRTFRGGPGSAPAGPAAGRAPGADRPGSGQWNGLHLHAVPERAPPPAPPLPRVQRLDAGGPRPLLPLRRPSRGRNGVTGSCGETLRGEERSRLRDV